MNAGNDLSNSLLDGIFNAFHQLGLAGKVVLGIFAFYFLFPYLLRILSFFRRGGERV